MLLHPQHLRFSTYIEWLMRAADHLNINYTDDPWSAAQRLCVTAHSMKAAVECPALVDYACLALILRRIQAPTMIVHAKMAEEIALRPPARLPASVPLLLKDAWVMEPHDPQRGDRLFGDTVAVAGYYQAQSQSFMLIGAHWSGRYRVVPWRPRWGSAQLGISMDRILDPHPYADVIDPHRAADEPAQQREWGEAAVRFVLGCVALLADPDVVTRTTVNGLPIGPAAHA